MISEKRLKELKGLTVKHGIKIVKLVDYGNENAIIADKTGKRSVVRLDSIHDYAFRHIQNQSQETVRQLCYDNMEKMISAIERAETETEITRILHGGRWAD